MSILVGILVLGLSVFSFMQCNKVARLEEENRGLCAALDCCKKLAKLRRKLNCAELIFERSAINSVISRFLKSDCKISESKAFLVVDGELHKVVDFDYKISENGKIIVNTLVLEPFTEKLAEPAIHGLYMAASSIDETVKREKARVLEEEIQGKQKELENLKK